MWTFLLSFIPGVGSFLSAAGSFIAKHWKLFVIGAMVGMLLYQNFATTRFLLWIPTIPHLEQQLAADETQIKDLKKDMAIAAKANADLTATIKDNNSTVQQWKDISDKLQQTNNNLVVTIGKMQHDTNAQVTEILKGKTPETCEASVQYLRDMKQKLTW